MVVYHLNSCHCNCNCVYSWIELGSGL